MRSSINHIEQKTEQDKIEQPNNFPMVKKYLEMRSNITINPNIHFFQVKLESEGHRVQQSLIIHNGKK